MEEFKIQEGEWIYMPARGEVVCVGKGVIAELVVTGDEDETGRKMAAAPDLLAALQVLFSSYKELADSGDAGFFRLEDYPEGQQALAAIAKALGK
ncbi:hypothetical protein ACVFA2_002320 [Escherichia coli]